MSTSNYGLPDGTEDFVGIKAKELEKLRLLFLNYFYKNNCELVIPSLIEFSEVFWNSRKPNESKGILTNPSESEETLRKRGSQAQVVWRAQLASASERAQRLMRKDVRSD